jgi:hypothetical protein
MNIRLRRSFMREPWMGWAAWLLMLDAAFIFGITYLVGYLMDGVEGACCQGHR